MSNAQVIFCLTTQSKYDASAKSSNVIYFCEDTKKIYVGAAEYTKTVEVLSGTPDSSVSGESGRIYAYNGNLYMCEVVGTNYVWSRVANVNDTKGTITKLIIGEGLTTSSGNTSVTESDTITHDTPNGAQSHSSTNLTQTPAFGGTFNIESISTDKFGHVTGIDSHTVKIPQQTAVSVGYENPDDVTSLSAQDEMTVVSDVKTGSIDHQIIKVYKTFKLPGDNNTTYTISKGTSDGTIQVVPSTGQPYEVSVTGWSDVAKKSDLNKIFKFCGSVNSVDDLPSSASEGNVYHVKSDGSEYVYATVDDNITPTWENLGTIFDATDYAKSADVISKVTGHGGEVPKFTTEGGLVSSGYTLNKSVPSDAKFTDTTYEHPTHDSKVSGLYKITVDEYGHVSGAVAVTSTDITQLGIPGQDTDTHYESKNVVGGSNATSDTSTALQNGQVYLIHLENGQITSKHKISGSGATTVSTDTEGNIVIQSTDTNTTYSEATTSSAGLQSAADKEKLNGVATGATKVAFSQALTSGTKVGTITINDQSIPLYAPTDTDTHHVTHLVVGAASDAIQNSAAANGNVHLVVLDNTTARDGVKIVGSGATEVTSDADGNITIHSTNTDTVYTLVAATSSALGGIKTGYSQSGKNYPVKLDTSNNAYVNVPWTDTNTVYTHPTSGVTAGTYKSVTVDVNGHVTGGSNPTTLAGYGITDAATPSDVSTALTTAKEYSDQLFNSLYNNSDSAVNSIMELVAAMEENSDAIDALDAVAASKADGKAFSTHIADTGLHVTSAKQTNWDSAYSHSTSSHAPSNAQANIIEGINVNGTSISPTSKVVNISVPTKLSELENDTGYTTDTVIEYGQATSAVLGLVKIGYTASGKNYPVQLNSSGQMYVNVPWTDTNTDTNVTQYVKSDNAAYPILLAASGQTGDATGAAYFDSGVTLNPSTNTIAANVSGSSASCSGNSATATKLASARTLSWTGDATGSFSFDGSANASTGLTLANSGVTAGSYGPSANASPAHSGAFNVPYITVDSKGRVTAASTKTITLPTDNNTDTKVTQTVTTSNASYPLLLAPSGQTATATTTSYFDSGVTLNPSTNTIAANISGSSASCSGNSATATKLATARTIALTGSVTGSGTFDGSGNLSIATSTNHTHNYAGSSSAGGSATSAVKLDTSAGSSIQPVYFKNGKPEPIAQALTSAAFKSIDTEVTSGSSNLITSGAVYTAINGVATGFVGTGVRTANVLNSECYIYITLNCKLAAGKYLIDMQYTPTWSLGDSDCYAVITDSSGSTVTIYCGTNIATNDCQYVLDYKTSSCSLYEY